MNACHPQNTLVLDTRVIVTVAFPAGDTDPALIGEGPPHTIYTHR